MIIIKVLVFVLPIFQYVYAARKKLPCSYTIDRGVERPEEEEFFQHVEDYMAKHEIALVVRGLLNKGHIHIDMRFYLQPNGNNSLAVLPDFLLVKLDDKFDREFLAKQLGEQKETVFLKMLKNSFSKTYYQADSVTVKPTQKFDDMDDDKVIYSYLEKIPANPFYMYLMMEIKANGLQLNKIEMSSDHRKQFCPLLEKRNSLSETLTQRDALINVTMKADNMTRKVNIIIPDISKSINTVKAAKKLYGGNHVVVPMDGKKSLVLIKLQSDSEENEGKGAKKRNIGVKPTSDDNGDNDDDDDGDTEDEQ